MRTGRTRAAAVLALLVCICASPVSATADGRPPLTRKAPYLTYSGINTEMDVNWQLFVTEEAVIAWGSDTLYQMGRAPTMEYGFDHQHAHTISGLTPGEVYHYRVTVGPEAFAGTFRAGAPDSAERVKFLAYGDTRSYPASHDTVAWAMVSTFTSDPEYQTVLLHVGDLVDNGDLEFDWDTEFFDPAYAGIQTLLRNIPCQAAIGNHERAGVLFRKYFPYPFVSDRYWSFDYGPAHFSVVDQYVDYGPGSPQLEWLEEDLATTTKPWKFIYLHEPGWTSGGGHENEIPVQDYIQPLCEQYEVAIVFGGHNHYYARAEVSGIQHVTTGGGGAPLRDPGTGYPFILVTAKVLHYCKVEIDGSSLEYEVVAPTGEVIDAVSLTLPLGVEETDAARLVLGQNRPNPFNPTTEISFTVPDAAERVTLGVYDVAGRAVRTLVDETLPAGPATAVWDGTDNTGRRLPSGVYLLKLTAGARSTSRSMVLLK